jgi:hypothetical protein
MSWAGLLAHWTAFAQSSLALPTTGDGARWREAVGPIIALQAVTHALADLDRTAVGKAGAGERALGQDRAEIIIAERARELHGLWRGEELPSEVGAIIADARAAIRVCRECGMEWSVRKVDVKGRPLERLELEHPSELAEALSGAGFDGDLLLASPGVAVMPGSPVAFARARFGGDPGEEVRDALRAFLVDVDNPRRVVSARQVYRQYDFGTGRVRRDWVVGGQESLAAGQPLLVPVIDRGRVCAVSLPPPPGALDKLRGIRVEFEAVESGV